MSSVSTKPKRRLLRKPRQAAPKKQKQGNRKKRDFDSLLFTSAIAAKSFKEKFDLRVIAQAYRIDLGSLKSVSKDFSEIFAAQRWLPLLKINEPIYPHLVKLFYCNLEKRAESLYSYVKGTHIVINLKTIENALGIKPLGAQAYCFNH